MRDTCSLHALCSCLQVQAAEGMCHRVIHISYDSSWEGFRVCQLPLYVRVLQLSGRRRAPNIASYSHHHEELEDLVVDL